jgi:hypothetical protein
MKPADISEKECEDWIKMYANRIEHWKSIGDSESLIREDLQRMEVYQAKLEGIKQGYAKALADVEKIVIKMMVEDNFVLIDGEELRSSLKELGK